jgi:hypothetical protein
MKGRVEKRAVAVAPDGRGGQGASVAGGLKAYRDPNRLRTGRGPRIAEAIGRKWKAAEKDIGKTLGAKALIENEQLTQR